MEYNAIVQQIIDEAERQAEIQGSFGRLGVIYWNTAENYIKKNNDYIIMDQFQKLKNTDSDCYNADDRIEKFLSALNVIFESKEDD